MENNMEELDNITRPVQIQHFKLEPHSSVPLLCKRENSSIKDTLTSLSSCDSLWNIFDWIKEMIFSWFSQPIERDKAFSDLLTLIKKANVTRREFYAHWKDVAKKDQHKVIKYYLMLKCHTDFTTSIGQENVEKQISLFKRDKGDFDWPLFSHAISLVQIKNKIKMLPDDSSLENRVLKLDLSDQKIFLKTIIYFFSDKLVLENVDDQILEIKHTHFDQMTDQKLEEMLNLIKNCDPVMLIAINRTLHWMRL